MYCIVCICLDLQDFISARRKEEDSASDSDSTDSEESVYSGLEEEEESEDDSSVVYFEVKFVISHAPSTSFSTNPRVKIFIVFPVFTLRNHLYIANCKYTLAAICSHFLC